jgi:hypothetical protein
MASILVAILLGGVWGGYRYWSGPEESAMLQSNQQPQPAPIDGERAYGYLKKICDLGPRLAGSEANSKQRQMVADHFKKLGATIKEQRFTSRDPSSGARVEMVNLIGSWFPERVDRVLIGAHYDTRPYPDREFDLVEQRKPFLGANDGASGVALLMEIAHHLKDSPTPWGVDLVLFDGEELVYGAQASIDDYFLGSKEFARVYADARKRGTIKYRYVYGLILDMIGDRDLAIPQEGYSRKLNPQLVRQVWDVARKVKARAFQDRVGTEVMDDHLPLTNAGIPTIDIIDFEYPHWHKASDLPDQCSAESLAQVGRVVTAWLNEPKSRRR